MTDIPADVMKAALQLFSTDFSENGDRPVWGSPDQFIGLIARAILAERERCAKYHEIEIERLERQIQENNEYAARHKEGCATANAYCRDLIACHKLAVSVIRR